MAENQGGIGGLWLVTGQSDEVGSADQGAPGETIEGADAQGSGGANQPTKPPGSPFGGMILWVPLILLFVFMIWTSSSTQRKEKKRREEMLTALKRHDRVQTIGGVIGAIVEIKDDEVVLKVDETNNIKMRFARSAVQQVISEGSTGDAVI